MPVTVPPGSFGECVNGDRSSTHCGAFSSGPIWPSRRRAERRPGQAEQARQQAEDRDGERRRTSATAGHCPSAAPTISGIWPASPVTTPIGDAGSETHRDQQQSRADECHQHVAAQVRRLG